MMGLDKSTELTPTVPKLRRSKDEPFQMQFFRGDFAYVYEIEDGKMPVLASAPQNDEEAEKPEAEKPEVENP